MHSFRRSLEEFQLDSAICAFAFGCHIDIHHHQLVRSHSSIHSFVLCIYLARTEKDDIEKTEMDCDNHLLDGRLDVIIIARNYWMEFLAAILILQDENILCKYRRIRCFYRWRS
jgi:hypothetical protein